ncbi:hypothetical protein CCACVL1_19241 [Corchorus capsularis]|uniref:Uncharacterized protein n=1 Tax=Corchorus capsularis TaxID=210143 RepID=A0A1R3HHJ8_COCAP|nr:hypothetical protein CCACVL1_19241 [Corchorus capsularis]
MVALTWSDGVTSNFEVNPEMEVKVEEFQWQA